MGSAEIIVTPVEQATDIDVFLDLPASIYRGDPNWVPPLRNDIVKQLFTDGAFAAYGQMQPFLAWRNGMPAGRIVAAVNQRLIEKEGHGVGLFGYFECIDDVDVAKAMFEQALEWLARRHCDSIRGPINLSTHLGGLVLVDGFDSPPYIMMPYTPRYYPGLLEAVGLQRAKDAYAYDFPKDLAHSDIFERGYRLARSAGVRFRPLRVRGKGFEDDCRNMYRVFTESFADNWSATPRSEDEFLEEAKALRLIVDPEIFPLAEYDGQLIGFCLSLPDINIALRHVDGRLNAVGTLKFLWHRRKIDRVRVLALAVLPHFRRTRLGVAAGLVYRGLQGGLNRYRRAEFSWVWEDNRASRNLIEAMGAIHYKTYRVYERSFSGWLRT